MSKRIRPSSIFVHILLAAMAFVFIYPLVWLFQSSLKTNTEIMTSPWTLPAVPQWDNYILAWTQANFPRLYWNSFFVTTITLIIVLIVSSMAAYGVQRLKWKLSSSTMMFFLIGMMVPIHVVIIPLYFNFSRMGLINNYISLILPYATFGLPSTILILSGFLSTIPRSLEEAAVIDGCTIPKAFLQIIIPIAQPALLTVGIFNFIGTWNELLVALIFIGNPGRFTLPIGLAQFVGMYSTNFAPMLAATSLAVIPTIIVYSIFNTRIVDGIAAGAIKA